MKYGKSVVLANQSDFRLTLKNGFHESSRLFYRLKGQGIISLPPKNPWTKEMSCDCENGSPILYDHVVENYFSEILFSAEKRFCVRQSN